jgi:hemolysin III
VIVLRAGAATGIVLTLGWVDAPEWLVALPVRATGGPGRSLFCPSSRRSGGAGRLRLRALHRGRRHQSQQASGPRLGRLGYHEIFHVLVIAAAALQYTAIAFFALPRARG